MDDGIWPGSLPSRLGIRQQRMVRFLKNRLDLELKPGWRIASVYGGVNEFHLEEAVRYGALFRLTLCEGWGRLLQSVRNNRKQ